MAAEELKKLGLQPVFYETPVTYEPFWFEKTDVNETRLWARRQLPTCAAICAVYFLFVKYGPVFMQNRKPFNLKKPLIIWNVLLAVFSICGSARVLPAFFAFLASPNGFHRSACESYGLNEPAAFWGFAFTLSKVAELIDTVFLVLRKKPLSLLHWFHHLSMVGATFFLFSEGEPVSVWSAVLNYFVHSIMYSYYTIAAIGVKFPKRISMTVTSIQILQFILGLSVNVYTLVVIGQGGKCFRTRNSILIYFLLGSVYLALFIRLFYTAYIAPAGKTKKQ